MRGGGGELRLCTSNRCGTKDSEDEKLVCYKKYPQYQIVTVPNSRGRPRLESVFETNKRLGQRDFDYGGDSSDACVSRRAEPAVGRHWSAPVVKEE